MSEHGIDTIIGDDIVFKGNLRFSNKLQINGQFKGTIESDGTLIIGEKGNLTGDISVGSLLVDGKLQGNSDASRLIQINKTGKVIGDIKTPEIQIQSGGKFIGNCVMD